MKQVPVDYIWYTCLVVYKPIFILKSLTMHTEQVERLKINNIFIKTLHRNIYSFVTTARLIVVVGYLYTSTIIVIIVFVDCPSTCKVAILSVMNFTVQNHVWLVMTRFNQLDSSLSNINIVLFFNLFLFFCFFKCTYCRSFTD